MNELTDTIITDDMEEAIKQSFKAGFRAGIKIVLGRIQNYQEVVMERAISHIPSPGAQIIAEQLKPYFQIILDHVIDIVETVQKEEPNLNLVLNMVDPSNDEIN